MDTKDHMLELVVHLGTALSTIYFFRKKIRTLEKKDFALIAIAILPLIPMYFFSKGTIEGLSKIKYIGFFLILTSFFLFKIKDRSKSIKNPDSFRRKIKDVLFIGFMQSVALVPGISRSGSTMFAASMRCWKIQEAITFSYLLSIPTILGGCVLEGLKVMRQTAYAGTLASYLAAFISSFAVGLILIGWVYKILCKGKFAPFAWYCLIAGIFITTYFFL